MFVVVITLLTGLIVLAYSALILSFWTGWNRLPERNTKHNQRSEVFISVIVPIRNERENIRQLVQNFHEQRFSLHHLEVVIVDDHSTDNGPEIIKELKLKNNWLKLVPSNGNGKKKALRTGISTATGELIITTDADCRFGKDWLQTVAETYLDQSPDMIVMPVGMEAGDKLQDKFQQLDYLSLQLVTAGAFGINKPIISSGANLAFKKKSYLETVASVPGKQYLSGDDVFLLHQFKAQNFKTVYLKSAQAMVKTYPATSFRQFMLQRMRWGGKSRDYIDPFAKFTAFLILISNSWLAIIPFLGLLNSYYLSVWGVAILLKMIIDHQFIHNGKNFFSINKIGLLQFFLFSLIYPYYVFTAGIGSILVKERWKDRKGH